MAMVVIAVLVILAISVSFWMLGGLIQLLLMLFMAGLVGWLADLAIPGRLPYGWLGAIAAGLVGSWLGTLLIGHVGPSPFGIPIIPALVGAIILAVGLELAGKALGRRRAY